MAKKAIKKPKIKKVEKVKTSDEAEKEMLHSARLREAGISHDYYENGDEYDEGDSSYNAHYNY